MLKAQTRTATRNFRRPFHKNVDMRTVAYKQDEVVPQTAKIIRASGKSIPQIARETGLSRQTIERILEEATYQPHPSTIRFILRACGYRLVIVPVS